MCWKGWWFLQGSEFALGPPPPSRGAQEGQSVLDSSWTAQAPAPQLLPLGFSCGGSVSLPREAQGPQAPAKLSEALCHLPQGRVSFKPSMDQQRSCPTCTDSLINGDFIITYDVNRESPANVQVPAWQPCWADWSSVPRGGGSWHRRGCSGVSCPDPQSSAQGQVSCAAWG